MERWDLNPNCWSGRSLWDSRSGASRDARIFSKILPMTLRREIGRYDSGSCGSLPGFGIMIVEADFHAFGKYEDARQLLIMVVRAWIAGSGRFFRRMGFISSGPGALEFFSRLMCDRTSSGEVSLLRSSSGSTGKLGGFSRKLCTSWEIFWKNFWLKLGFCGVVWID